MISALVTSLIGADNVSGYSVGVKPAAYAKTPEAHEARNTAHLLFRKLRTKVRGFLFVKWPWLI